MRHFAVLFTLLLMVLNHHKQLKKCRDSVRQVSEGLEAIRAQQKNIFDALLAANCQIKKQSAALSFTLKHFLKPLTRQLRETVHTDPDEEFLPPNQQTLTQTQTV